MPLNGRQFANLAATIPGVTMGFHTDPTKSTQYSPQIGGGNGRNLNYQIDGGDNNDDTVGGLLQLFPLEAIQEFNFVTSRYKAEYGRSNGGVMNIVTKSGTNQMQGSWFTLLRDDTMNSMTRDREGQRQREAGLSPVSVRRIVRRTDRARPRPLLRCVRADAAGHVPDRRHAGTLPERGRHVRDALSREAADRKGTMNLNPQHYMSVRYGRNENSQPYGADPLVAAERVGHEREHFNSFNVNHNWVLGGSKLNEFIFQYADFRNHIGANSLDPTQIFRNSVSHRAERQHAADDRTEEVSVPQ